MIRTVASAILGQLQLSSPDSHEPLLHAGGQPPQSPGQLPQFSPHSPSQRRCRSSRSSPRRSPPDSCSCPRRRRRCRSRRRTGRRRSPRRSSGVSRRRSRRRRRRRGCSPGGSCRRSRPRCRCRRRSTNSRRDSSRSSRRRRRRPLPHWQPQSVGQLPQTRPARRSSCRSCCTGRSRRCSSGRSRRPRRPSCRSKCRSRRCRSGSSRRPRRCRRRTRTRSLRCTTRSSRPARTPSCRTPGRFRSRPRTTRRSRRRRLASPLPQHDPQSTRQLWQVSPSPQVLSPHSQLQSAAQSSQSRRARRRRCRSSRGSRRQRCRCPPAARRSSSRPGNTCRCTRRERKHHPPGGTVGKRQLSGIRVGESSWALPATRRWPSATCCPSAAGGTSILAAMGRLTSSSIWKCCSTSMRSPVSTTRSMAASWSEQREPMPSTTVKVVVRRRLLVGATLEEEQGEGASAKSASASRPARGARARLPGTCATAHDHDDRSRCCIAATTDAPGGQKGAPRCEDDARVSLGPSGLGPPGPACCNTSGRRPAVLAHWAHRRGSSAQASPRVLLTALVRGAVSSLRRQPGAADLVLAQPQPPPPPCSPRRPPSCRAKSCRPRPPARPAGAAGAARPARACLATRAAGHRATAAAFRRCRPCPRSRTGRRAGRPAAWLRARRNRP